MAKRLLPYKVENPYDVVVGFALEDAYINNTPADNGFGDEGVLVTVSSANLDAAPVSFSSDSYLGKTDYNGVGWNQRPSVTRKIKPAVSGDIPLGFALKETALYDENGQYLSRYSQKALECNVAIKGQDIPVLTKGQLTLSVYAIDGTLTVGQGIKPSTVSGKVTGCAASDTQRFGLVLGTGSRDNSLGTYADGWSGQYAQVKFDCK
jgi:hypothetical protein